MECTPGAISQFKTRHKEEIQTMMAGITEKTDHLWIAHRANRIAALDQMHSDLQDFKEQRLRDQTDLSKFPAIKPDTHGYQAIEVKYYGRNRVETYKFDAGLANTEMAILRRAAEELGQLSSDRTTLSVDLTQNNLNVSLFDRAAIMKALKDEGIDGTSRMIQ